MMPLPTWFMWLKHIDVRAFSLAWAKTGKRMAARIAMMAITTSSSISVNAGFRIRCIRPPFLLGVLPLPVRARRLSDGSRFAPTLHGDVPAIQQSPGTVLVAFHPHVEPAFRDFLPTPGLFSRRPP